MDQSRGRNEREGWKGRTSWLRGTLIDLGWVQITLAVVVNKHLDSVASVKWVDVLCPVLSEELSMHIQSTSLNQV